MIGLSEQIIAEIWALIGFELPCPAAAAHLHRGHGPVRPDKPDLRFDLQLTELTDYFADTPFRVFQAPYVGAIVMPGGAS